MGGFVADASGPARARSRSRQLQGGIAGIRDPAGRDPDDLILKTPKLAHNTYLQFATEEGSIGVLLFLLLTAACVASAVAVARAAEQQGDEFFERLSRSVVVAQVAVLAASFFFTYTVGKPLWLTLALGPGLLAATTGEHCRIALSARRSSRSALS